MVSHSHSNRKVTNTGFHQLSVRYFLDGGLICQDPLPVGSTISGQGGLSCVGKADKLARGSELVSSVLPWSLLQLPPPGLSATTSLSEELLPEGAKLNKPFPLKLLLIMIII